MKKKTGRWGRKIHSIRAAAAVLILALAALLVSSCGKTSDAEGSSADSSVYGESSASEGSDGSSDGGDSSSDADDSEQETTVETIDAAEAGIYDEILDMFWDGIKNGWSGYGENDELSYLWYEYGLAGDLSDAGYAFIDLDGNGMPELLVGLVSEAQEGIFYDLYTYDDGDVIHLASAGERWSYRLCYKNYIGYEGADSASEGTYAFYSVDGASLVFEASLSYVYDDNSDVTWMYKNEEDAESSVVTEAEADLLISTFSAQEYELTPFDEY